jgi:polysaccharide pyruvyl transferase WcaK-like protein
MATGPLRRDGVATSRPLRIALYGEFGTENLGNDGSLRAAVRLLRARLPDCELTAVCVHPDVVRAEHDVAAVAMHPPAPSGVPPVLGPLVRVALKLGDPLWCWHVLRGFDALVVSGTGIVEDSGAMKAWHAPWSLFGVALAARARGATVAFLDVGASPATTRAKRFLFGSALRMAAYRSYRDPYSLDAARRLGVRDAEYAVHPDVCFTLPLPAEGDVERPSGGDGVEIGVGVMSYHGEDPEPGARRRAHGRYVAEVTEFAAGQVRAERTVRMVIGESTDLAVARTIAAEVELRCGLPVGSIRAEGVRDLEGVLREVRGVDAFVATRFHNLVCALMVGTPVVTISYAPKNRALMRAVGLEEYCVDIDRVDADFLERSIDEVLERSAAIREQIATRTSDYAGRVREQVDHLAEHLERKASRRTRRIL